MLDPSSYSGALIWGAVFMAAATIVSWVIGRSVRRLGALDEEHPDRLARIRFVLQLVRVVVFIIFFILWAHLVPALRAFGTALLASASVISIVLGIAAQNALGNLVAGVSILAYRPFEVGDRIQVTAPTGLETGVIEFINLSHTVIRTFDNRRVTIPNGQAMNQTMVNLTSEDPKVMAVVTVPVAYSTRLEDAREILRAFASQHPQVLELVGMPVTELASSSVNLSARMWCADAASAKQVEFDLYEAVLEAFPRAGIEIPYPWSNVVVH